MNMSYCQFQNTLQDLQQCYNSINEQLDSQDEHNARRRMIALCQSIVDEAEPFASESYAPLADEAEDDEGASERPKARARKHC